MKCYNKHCDLIVAHGVEWDCPNSLNCAGFDDTPLNLIDHPTHYQGAYECIDIMREIFGDDAVRSFCICNAYKYRFRAGKKRGETAQSDMDKAAWYETYMMEHLINNRTLEWERIAKRQSELCKRPMADE